MSQIEIVQFPSSPGGDRLMKIFQDKIIYLTPYLVEELSGIINLDKNFDFKEDYTNYLVEKYQ